MALTCDIAAHETSRLFWKVELPRVVAGRPQSHLQCSECAGRSTQKPKHRARKDMENQHRKISGYRELSQEEIDLMNRIKEKGQELLDLQAELVVHLGNYHRELQESLPRGAEFDDPELNRFLCAEPTKWAAIGKADIQTGIMALVRAVAQPTTC